MKRPLRELAIIERGMRLSNDEKTQPHNISDVKELFLLKYPQVYSYNKVPTLSNTINFTDVENDEKVYVNLSNKFKNSIIQKNDILLPVTNVDFEPKFITWEDDKRLDYIYHQKLILLRPNVSQILPQYLFFILNTDYVREYWRQNSKDGERYRLVCKTVEQFEIDVPSMEEQKAIVERTIKNNIERVEINNIYEELSKR